MSSVVGQVTPQRHDCPRCGTEHPSRIEATVCCLFAPEATGWCAWCGEDLGGGLVFCDARCARDYAT